MSWDDTEPKPKPTAFIGEDLSTLSVGELEARIALFEREIARVRDEVQRKKARQAAADQLFKR
ncbi:MAG TPA: DUF1192 domain-containing protein [Hyphomicrobiaceae bacterium]|nr:DUF1192 domain-containing protein [Hyphomicrobiaceae bacterium]